MPGRVPKEVTRQREAHAWQLRQQGCTHQRIAGDLGVDRSTVTAMLARIDRRALAQLNAAVELLKVEQTEILRDVVYEARQAWEKSKSPAVAKKVTKTKKPGDDKGEGDADADVTAQESMTQEVQCGDVAYLAQVRAALADIRKVWGLDAPVKNANTTPDGKEAAGALPTEVIAARVAALVSTAKARMEKGERPPAALQPPAANEPCE